jgi:hypothetical protein
VTSRRNPFPGLRPFESNESALFFGRDEQCDELLARLARRRLVAVVGASGSGKSSLVRAGLLPALQRGYLPAAGSSWRIVVFRPGGNPLGNLTDGLLAAAASDSPALDMTRDSLTEFLASSSLGLVSAARRLLAGGQSSLLVLVDQFEEIFRFRDLAGSADAEEEAVECINLLLGAAGQSDVPVYVVLTMRSDYIGDCTRFAGLPEALNDSQFLVPRMTRDQLRAAIEGPVAVGGARIAPRLVQRLLHDVDALARRTTPKPASAARHEEYDHDQLPVLQHALMRVWEVSSDLRARGGEIDLAHYELPPVETIHHALDKHAEEVYADLPSEAHREAARRTFQRLTERDWDNREVRRPTPFSELVAVARGASPSQPDVTASIVRRVLDEFSAAGRAFVVVNAQQHVDISHESFIRKWMRLRTWVQQESQSRRTYLRLAETAASWEEGQASLYRGPELAEAHAWWRREVPSPEWARRYDQGFETAARFLRRSLRHQRGRRLAFAGAVVATIVIAVVMTALWARAREAERRAVTAESDAKRARNEAVRAVEDLNRARTLEAQAREAARSGNAKLAAALNSQAQQYAEQSGSRQVLTSSEAKEVERLRLAAADSAGQLKMLQARFDDVSGRLVEAASEANRLRDSNTTLTRERDSLNDQLLKAREQFKATSEERNAVKARLEDAASQLKTAIEERNALKIRLDDALGQPARAGGVAIEAAVKGNYRDIYERAITAKSRKQWREAERLFEAAARLQADTGEPVAMQGFGTEPYVPNYHLGMVRRQLACDAWDRAEKDGAISKLKDYQTMVEQRKGCESR